MIGCNRKFRKKKDLVRFWNEIKIPMLGIQNVIQEENMTARRTTAGRIIGKRAVAGVTLAVAATALVLATEFPAGLSAVGGGSAALAELAARSPGMRIGGVALKAKAPRSALAPAPDAAPGAAAPGSAVASVLGTAVGPEGPVPGSGPVGPGGFPSDFTAPDVPNSLAPGAPAGSEATPPADFSNIPSPPIGGVPIFGPGIGGGGGTPGNGGETGTTPGGETPGGENPVAPPPPPPPVGPVPEPSVWLMLMAGFGFVGSAMRRARRVRLA